MSETGVITATGRRKSAIARVRLKPGTGQLLINGRPMTEYFPREALHMRIQNPFEVSATEGRWDVVATIHGGGVSGQADALRHGIARALEAWARARGQGFLRLDYRGHGASEGRFEEGTIGLWLEDALAAFDALTEGPQVLVGSSMGGWIALLLARARPEREANLRVGRTRQRAEVERRDAHDFVAALFENL